jgi:peptidylprolyl isomerase
MRLLFCLVAIVALTACDATPRTGVPQIPPPADVAAVPADAVRTSTNLASKVIKPGTGTRHPRPNSVVTVHYTGWTTDGKTFDSSVSRGQPLQFGLDRVIDGWTEGLQLMVEGETRRFWIPGRLAYDGAPGKPQGTLVFDIELIRIDS